MKQPLVTILSPVYNGEKYISRFIDSILSQDYKSIEFILVNDGSTDKTDKIVNSYKKKLKKKLYSFKYINQENMGAAGAINTGLKYVTGEYLTWPDSDDILTPNSISMKVDFLEKNKEYGYVRTEALAFNENDLTKPIYRIKRKDNKNNKTDLFYEFLLDKNIYYCDGCYMVRMNSFKKHNPEMNIYVTKWGQNWQLFLPISYYEKCGFIKDISYYYLERKSSHSHNQNNYDDFIRKYNGYEDILINVLEGMDIKEKKELKKLVNIKYSHIRLELSVTYKKEKEFKKEYKYLKELEKLTFKEMLYNIFSNKLLIQNVFKFFNKLISIPEKIKNKIIKVVCKDDRF